MTNDQNNLNDKIESNHRDMRDKIELIKDSLNTKISAAENKITSIESVISTAKLIGILGATITAILGAVGINQIVNKLSTLDESIKTARTTAENAKSITLEFGTVTQRAIVQSINAEFDTIDTLDALKDNNISVGTLDSLSKELREVNAKLPENEQSHYDFVVTALHLYWDNDCDNALKKLDNVTDSDRRHFIYHYMRGACLLRTNDPTEAEKEYAKASELTGGRRALMSSNLAAVTKLFQARASNDPKQLRDAAITDLLRLKENNEQFSPAYQNLACAYAERGDYKEVGHFLTAQLKLNPPVSSDQLLDKIHGDLIRPNEKFLANYVKQWLRVTLPSDDPNWRTQMRKALHL